MKFFALLMNVVLAFTVTASSALANAPTHSIRPMPRPFILTFVPMKIGLTVSDLESCAGEPRQAFTYTDDPAMAGLYWLGVGDGPNLCTQVVYVPGKEAQAFPSDVDLIELVGRIRLQAQNDGKPVTFSVDGIVYQVEWSE